MDLDPALAHLLALHEGLPRQGPGDAASTRRALALCRDLPAAPQILDLGCGAGAQTLDLLAATDGHVTAVDLFPAMLDGLEDRARAAGVADRLTVVVGDMADPPAAPGSVDLVWAEGAIYLMGFRAGLTRWRELLHPGGWIAVTEMTWLTDDPPEEIAAFWREAYPGMGTVDGNIATAEALGFRVEPTFVLPPVAWEAYHGPLADRLDRYAEAHADDPVAQAVVAETRREIALRTRYAAHHDYVFYVMQAV